MVDDKKKADQEQIDNMVDEGGPSYSEQMMDELEPIYQDDEMDYSGAFESDVEEVEEEYDTEGAVPVSKDNAERGSW